MNPAQTRRSSLPRAVGLVIAALLAVAVQWWAPGTLSGVERASGDLTWRLVASAERSERRVVIVDIDESSLAQVGPWPWPRTTIELLSRRLTQAGTATQVFDMVFPEPREGDVALAATLAQGSVTTGQIFSVDPAVAPQVGEVSGALGSVGCPSFAPRSHGYIANAPELRGGTASVGHLTPRIEHDGVIRMVPALICHQDRAYPALALAALWRLAQPTAPGATRAAPDWRWTERAAGAAGWLAPAATLISSSLPGLVVSIDAAGDMRVPYRINRNSFVSVSAADVLSSRADPSLLKGAVALIGATAFGLGDSKSTPQAAVASGLEVQAQLLVGLLDARMPYTPAGANFIQWFAGLAGLALLFVITQRPKASAVKRLPIVGAVLALTFFAGSVLLLWQFDIWLPWALPALMAILGSVILATVEHGITRAQRERLSAHLGAYLPEPVARRLMRTDPSGSIQVEQRPVSVLVADIRNFSAFVTHRPPEETTTLLHAFCCIAVDVVEAHGGVVENVVGDSILAVWNAYSDCPDHAQQSVQAAQELIRATRPLLGLRHAAHEADAVQPLALGVGIETGLALVGSFGPIRRRAHAALGEPVSVAARLQNMTQELSFPILVGPQVAKALPVASTELVGEYLLEGLTQHYAVYAPVGWADLLAADLTWSKLNPGAAGADAAPPPAAAGLPLAAPFGKPFATSADH